MAAAEKPDLEPAPAKTRKTVVAKEPEPPAEVSPPEVNFVPPACGVATSGPHAGSSPPVGELMG